MKLHCPKCLKEREFTSKLDSLRCNKCGNEHALHDNALKLEKSQKEAENSDANTQGDISNTEDILKNVLDLEAEIQRSIRDLNFKDPPQLEKKRRNVDSQMQESDTFVLKESKKGYNSDGSPQLTGSNDYKKVVGKSNPNNRDTLYEPLFQGVPKASAEESEKMADDVKANLEKPSRKEIKRTIKAENKARLRRYTKAGLTGLSILFLIALLSFLFVSKKKKDLREKVLVEEYAQIVNQEQVNLARYIEVYDSDDAKDALKSYFECKNIDQAKSMILYDANLDPVLEKYWKPRSYDNIKFLPALSKQTPNSKGVSHTFNCSNNDSIAQFLYTLYKIDNSDKWLVDWRFAEQIEDMPVSDIHSQRIEGKVKVRCLLILEDYYNFGYNSDKWLSFSCYQSTSILDNPITIRCYLEKGTERYKEVCEALESQSKYNPKLVQKPQIILDSILNESLLMEKFKRKRPDRLTKYHARLIVELDVKDPVSGIAEISDFITDDIQDYFENFQLPYLEAQNRK